MPGIDAGSPLAKLISDMEAEQSRRQLRAARIDKVADEMKKPGEQPARRELQRRSERVHRSARLLREAIAAIKLEPLADG